MFVIYAIYSDRHDKIYIGFTSDLKGRLFAHNHPSNKGWTARFMPWKLLYSEEVSSKPEALVREKQLKSYQGRVFIRSLLKN